MRNYTTHTQYLKYPLETPNS